MIEVLKILKKIDKINREILFEMINTTTTRDSGMKLQARRYNTIVCKSYFNDKVVEHWNTHSLSS